MKVISCARNLSALALAAALSMTTYPSAAKDIVGFVDQVTKQANPGLILILHNREAWTSNIVDTIAGQLNVKKFKFDLTTYNQGDRPHDIARPFNWPTYGAVICMGQNVDCDWIKAEADQKGFEGDFYNAYLAKR
ncbi:hypothetical protein RFN25_27175 [Mesorhizobium abyssinicae]|uniref:hypothetical protein n=1 Tax=Mesorhizobium abyssinicae TaxID=1209958 RepID=UPI002A24AA41|nr:hypothetical protein [Mesorhizobium abyssinicae]MDX8437114.1 hypothetical protein [Mesorhizobium abyssinicae]